MSALPFGYVFSLVFVKKTTRFTVCCRHAHSDWKSTGAFFYVIRKSNIMLTWTYIIVLNI